MTYVTSQKLFRRFLFMHKLEITASVLKEIEKYGYHNIDAYHPYLVTYEASELICQEDLPISNLMIVLNGTAKVFNNMENGKRLLCCFFTKGSIIGDMEFLSERKNAVSSVQAITPMSCLVIPVLQNASLLYQDTALLRLLGKGMARKFELTTRNYAHNILYPLEVRLCSYIDTGCTTDVFDEKLTEVADVLGTSYRHLIRALNSLIHDGILSKEKQVYYIINRDELRLRSKDFFKPMEGQFS